MKKSLRDKISDFLLLLLRPVVNIWMRIDMNTTVKKDSNIDFKRKEPFILLANHTFMFDVVHVPLRFKVTPFIVASQDLLTQQPLKFILTYIAKCIPKSKGKSDIRTTKSLIKAIKKGYPILIFPEGDSTFYGETGYIEPSTAKLIKMMKIDVITCKVSGGHISNPRWATSKRKNRHIELNYELAISKNDIKDMKADEIYATLCDKLYHNDYDYQREQMIMHKGNNLAEGLENIIYCCSECEAINSFETDGSKIKCTNCNTEGHIDEYGFIKGFKFDNTVEWNKYQRKLTDKLREQKFTVGGEMSIINYVKDNREKVGAVQVTYDNNKLIISGSHNETINIDDMKHTIVTMRRNFSFVYNDKNYFIKLDAHAISFLRACQDKY